jgi:hypothetical protein
MGKGRLAALCAALGLVAPLTACFTHDGHARSANREALMKQTDDCNAGIAYQCKTLGDDLLGKSLRSRTSDWFQGHDARGAKRAYTRGCILGDASSCAAIIEHGLFGSPEEKSRYELRIAFRGGVIRSGDELAAAEAKLLEERRVKEEELRKTRAAEEADSRRSWAAFGQGVQQAQPEIEATFNRAAGGGRPAGGAGAGGLGGGAKPDCSACNKDLSVCSGQGATSPRCYERMAEVNDCLASRAGCSKDPAAARAEAARLRKAAAEVKR